MLVNAALVSDELWRIIQSLLPPDPLAEIADGATQNWRQARHPIHRVEAQ